MKKMAFLMVLGLSSTAWAGKSENIAACVQAAQQYAGVQLNEFEASYTGGWTSFKTVHTVKWPNALCEIKIMGTVYNLVVNGVKYIDQGFAGTEARQLNEKLEAETEKAIQQLEAQIKKIKQGIDLLEERMESTSKKLQQPNPDLEAAERYIQEGIEKAYQTFLIQPPAAEPAQTDQSTEGVAPAE